MIRCKDTLAANEYMVERKKSCKNVILNLLFMSKDSYIKESIAYRDRMNKTLNLFDAQPESLLYLTFALVLMAECREARGFQTSSISDEMLRMVS